MSKKVLSLFARPRRPIYEGRTKVVYEGPEAGTLTHSYRDNTLAGDVIAGKGVINNRISAHLMTALETVAIPTHFLKSVNMREQQVRTLDMLPLCLEIHTIAAGDFAKRLGLQEGLVLPRPMIDFYLKNKDLNNPWVSEEHILNLGWMNPYELDEVIGLALRANDYLSGLFSGIGYKMTDLRLEFGRLYGDMDEVYMILADELSPDTFRLWDERRGEKWDFGVPPAGIQPSEAYQNVAHRLGLLPKGPIILDGAVNEEVAESLGDIENARQAGTHRLRAVPKSAPPPRR